MLLNWIVLLSCCHALLALAIEVTDKSPCADACGGGLTSASDIVCNDADYENTGQGQKMRDCLTCESSSKAYSNETDNDVYWFLCERPCIRFDQALG